ncbi:MAG: hypothetical protein OEM82_05505 [Acidobacteriota bacterium]|nr:hypothetical protein [Acidobacteriota bacterium]MDH3530209.1 hypothetical protein [Acidobacteriota bacterium]
MRPRTKRQREIYDYISEFVASHGHDPSYKQIAHHFGMNSKGGIAKHIAALEDQGLLARRRQNGHFSLELNPRNSVEEITCRIKWLKLPETCDEVPPEFELIIPRAMTGIHSPKKLRGFVVPNNAMIDAQIREGDIALIERREFARDRDCVVAEIPDGEVILSGYRRAGAEVEFVPANKKYDRLRFAADKIRILGIYRGLLRAPL